MNCARCQKKHRGLSGLLPWKTGKKTITYAGQGGLEDGPLKRIKYGVPEYRMLCSTSAAVSALPALNDWSSSSFRAS